VWEAAGGPFLLANSVYVVYAVEDLDEEVAMESESGGSVPQRKQPADKVVPIRLSTDEWQALKDLAAEQGIGLSTYLRDIVVRSIPREVKAMAEPSMALERGEQYDRRQVVDGDLVTWVDFVHERGMPDDAEEYHQGGVRFRMSSALKHTFRAIVRDRNNREMFTVEYVTYGPGDTFPPDPRRRDGPLRREVGRRLMERDWEADGWYQIEE
jgi:hypothetical protein